MPTPYSPTGGRVKPKLRTFLAEELVGDLNQDARAVAGFRIASAGATMREIDEDLDAFCDNLVRWLPFNVDDKANAAGIFLVPRIVQSLRTGRPLLFTRGPSFLRGPE